MSRGTEPSAESSVLSLPRGGGAIGGLGETFTPDAFTGTGNLSVPLAVPAGRSGLQPQLALAYSSGAGTGPFGLGWQLNLQGVSRKTSRGLPRYLEPGSAGTERADTFVLSGAEDLVPIGDNHSGRVSYRPRTEGLFARIEHIRDSSGDYWEIRGRDGLLSRYGTPRPDGADPTWRDPATLADPDDPGRIFGWRPSETRDLLGNLIRYEYLRDAGRQDGHVWDQPLISRISYADHGDRTDPSFLITVDFGYEPRPDPGSQYRCGFEVRTSLRCRSARVLTHAADGLTRAAREYRFGYEQAAFTGISLLTSVQVVGISDSGDGAGEVLEPLPPLTFGYTRFEPEGRRFEPVAGPGLPTTVLSDPTFCLLDTAGTGLPDVIELGAARRVWRNAGAGRFDLPRNLPDAPGVSLADPGVRLLDADGDGRADLLVSSASGGAGAASAGAASGGAGAASRGAGGRGAGPATGYYPMTFAGGWSRRSFQPYRQSASISLADPAVRLIDLDGDGLSDILRSGTRLECWFNDPDPQLAWLRTSVTDASGPGLDLADPRVRLADMTGDGLQDLVLLSNGDIAYWPNLGYGRWGARVQMRHSPRLPEGFNPRRLLLGDVDGDGAADLIYLDLGRVLLWGNQSGNAWSEQPVTVRGVPAVSDADALHLSDLFGTGMAGLLFGPASADPSRSGLRFLDFSGGTKPHLLQTADNHLGALTRVTYTPSTQEYLRDQRDPATRWRTTLPFPVHVVSAVEVTDTISGGRLSTEYRYHHGYWDGVEREFRGFARVEHLDTEAFRTSPDLPEEHYSPPTLTKSWFHPGPVAALEAGDWTELDLSAEYWPGDRPMLSRPASQNAFLNGLPRDARRAALRTLRGQVLRTELYALDGTDRQHRPWTVTESSCGLRQEPPSPPAGAENPVLATTPAGERSFFPLSLGSRTTQYERGEDPMTRFEFPTGYDDYGCPTGHLAIAVPRGRDPLAAASPGAEPYLATYETIEYARRDDPEHYLVDRIARTTRAEVVNDGLLSVPDLREAVLRGPGAGSGTALRVIEDTRSYYDGEAFTGLALGALGDHGLIVRTESLTFTDEFLDGLFDQTDPDATRHRPPYLIPEAPAGSEGAGWPAEYPQEFGQLLAPSAGYVHHDAGTASGSPAGWFRTTARQQYDVHLPGRAPRGLLISSLDPLGGQTRIDYDEHDLLPVATSDAVGLVTEGVFDLRTLQPLAVTDPNGNTESITYSPAGLVTARYRRGKDGAGDRDVPSVSLSYDLAAFAERGQPVSVRTARRVHHDGDPVAPEQRDDVLVSVAFCDGFGRTLQTRAQAGDTLFGQPRFGGALIPLEQSEPVGDTAGQTRSATDPDNVIVSGWRVFDNKGRIVHEYEPFLSTGWDYRRPAEEELGQKAVMFYDPPGRMVATVRPDGSQQRVVFGVPVDLSDPDRYEPTPWESFSYDGNDNAGRTHPGSAEAYREHWNTPASAEVDALGRTVRTVLRNGGPQDAETQWFTTLSAYDIQGRLVSLRDALGREAFRYTLDLAGRRWRVQSIDAGVRDVVPDALDGPVECRDGKGALTLAGYDALHRSSRVWARDVAGGTVTLRQRLEYGDAGRPDQPADARAAARRANLLTHVVRHHDEAGLLSVAAIDFKGNLVQTSRRVIADAPILATYAAAEQDGWQVTPFQVDWSVPAGRTETEHDDALLEARSYESSTEFDALDRETRHLFPADVEGRRSEYVPSYDRAGRLAQVHLDGAVLVQRIAYDAKGKRVLLAHGNGVMTRYAYHPNTFQLGRLRSERYSLVGELTYRPSGQPLQDYGYSYDLAGNVLSISDRTPGSGIPANPEALRPGDARLRRLLGSGDALERLFGYDPLYRLLSATGREAQSPAPGEAWLDAPRGTDPTQTQRYEERFDYDAAGNLLALEHRSAGGYTRTFSLAAGNNRLQQWRTGDNLYENTFDACGNLSAETSSRRFRWNHADRLIAFATQTDGGEPSVHAQYLYDAAGQRVKKLVRRQGGAVEVRHYLDEVFEHQRWSGPDAGENTLVHVRDGARRVALLRRGPAHPADRGPAVAIQLEDHLGSSSVVLDETGALVSREEFTPYGETSFGSYARKRFRFTGEERDEESGLAYHSARYLAPWSGRWVSCDPAGPGGGVNLYSYSAGNPIRLVDPSGLGVWDRVWGGVKTIGGALETAAGAAITGVGVATSELGIGVPIAALGAVVMAHGVDTTVSGVRTVYEGSPVDSFTAQGLQGLGMSRRGANLVDAGIGLVFSLGSALFAKAPAVLGGAARADAFAHLTSAEGAAAINASNTLGRGAGTVYAGSSSLATASRTTVAVKTGLTGKAVAASVNVPGSAASALRVPVAIGPGTLWQRLSGTVYSAGAGSFNLSTGAFTRTGIAWTQWKWYVFDAWVSGLLRASPALDLPADSAPRSDPSTSAPAPSSSLLRMRGHEPARRARPGPALTLSRSLSGD